MNKCSLMLLMLLPMWVSAQRMVPIGETFRDAYFAPRQFTDIDSLDEILIRSTYPSGPSFFPVSENQTDIYRFLKDTTKRYSSVGYYLYQRELIELKDGNARLWITPLFDVSYTKELNDTTGKRYQNTRGARAEGTFGKRVFFTTSFYENQAVLMSYADAYVRQRGEQYAQPDSTYKTSNAVIPGAARTKPFKEGMGFDYAYATGMVSIAATSKLTIHWGNQPFFIGSGHRSLLWSDNSTALMNLRVRYRFSPKWEAQLVRARGFNLMRRAITSSAEAYYEPKLFSIATIYFQPTEKLSIGVFEGGSWYRGDSITQGRIPALYYIPLPGVAALQQQLNASSALAIIGMDFKLGLGKHWIYGQAAFTQGQQNGLAYQLGARIFPTKNPFLQLQLEYNHADSKAYSASNPRNNYSHYNLPVAHPLGAGFDELLLRCSWEKNHYFAALQVNYFPKQTENATLLMPVVINTYTGTQTVINQSLEAGYRFNRTYCLEVFGAFRYRHANGGLTNYEHAWISLGLRTQLNNHYFDF